MLERKIEQALRDWKAQNKKKCLLVDGARQVGKTSSIRKFAREQYKHFVEINFVENPSYKAIFEGDFDVDTLVKQINLRVPDAKLIPAETLIFLDEIQDCPNARTALKFFYSDGRFDVIASGSMMGVHYKDQADSIASVPVGAVEHLSMYSLDFEEFLWANDVPKESIEDIRGYFSARAPVPTAMHEKMMELFREYIVIGGMPQVVAEFVSSLDFSAAFKIQRDILRDYLDDIAKYASSAERVKARECFLSIPKHLAKDYKKFRYSLVSNKGTARMYAGSLMWLFDAGIINFCHNLAAPELPLEGNAQEHIFKVYMRDTGLLTAMLEEGSQQDIIDGNLGIYKGAIFENVVADIFAKAGKKLYYFEKRSRLEVDFVIRYQGQAAGIEVKSAGNTKSKSLDSLLDNYGVPYGIKLSSKNVGTVQGKNIDIVPLYMAMFL